MNYLFRFSLLLIVVNISFAYSQTIDSNLIRKPYVLWAGTNSQMTFLEFASYCAPVFWFSPDEPELKNKQGKDILIPANFPFEKSSGTPVVYYQLRSILTDENVKYNAVKINFLDMNKSIIDLSKIGGIDVDYSHYYADEKGMGGHKHDTEQTQFKIYIEHNKINDTLTLYRFILLQVTAKAHALAWLDNIYNLDTNTTELKLPFNILVEEGKHASCTDINGDGVYTPGYDVNVRTNDAWGVRDIIRTGSLFTSEFQSYMAKVRRPEYRVFPPLPDDSHLKSKYSTNGIYSPENAIYELRPMPPSEKALPDISLQKDMSGYIAKNWPDVKEDTDVRKFYKWWETDLFIKSIGVSAFYDKDFGISFTFPLLILKNIETPVIGGWMVNRIYLKNEKLRDFGYNILFTPSASRFMDPYFATGFEINNYKIEGTESFDCKWEFVMETGFKFRGNVKFSFLKFLSVLTDFWGFRIGIKNTGFPNINRLTYVLEFCAGVW